MNLDCYLDADFSGFWKNEDDQDTVCENSRTRWLYIALGMKASDLYLPIKLGGWKIALSQAMQNIIPLRKFLQEVGTQLKMDFVSPIIIHFTVFEDNNGPLGLDISLSKTPRNRHIAVKYYFFRIHVGKDIGIMI